MAYKIFLIFIFILLNNPVSLEYPTSSEYPTTSQSAIEATNQNCNCSTPQTLYYSQNNITNQTFVPTNSTNPSVYCPNMRCSWTLNFEEILNNSSENIIKLNATDQIYHEDSFIIYECDTGKIMLNSSAHDDIDLYTQAANICINLTSVSRDDNETDYRLEIKLSLVGLTKVDVG